MLLNNYAKKYRNKIKKQLNENSYKYEYFQSLPKTIFHKLKYTDKFHKCNCRWCIDSRLLQQRKITELANDMIKDYENE